MCVYDGYVMLLLCGGVVLVGWRCEFVNSQTLYFLLVCDCVFLCVYVWNWMDFGDAVLFMSFVFCFLHFYFSVFFFRGAKDLHHSAKFKHKNRKTFLV